MWNADRAAPGAGEKDGEDYFFTSVQEFHELLEKDAFLENEMIHGNYYGTRKKTVFEKIEDKQDILINIDVKGAESLRKEIYKDRNFEVKMITILLRYSLYVKYGIPGFILSTG